MHHLSVGCCSRSGSSSHRSHHTKHHHRVPTQRRSLLQGIFNNPNSDLEISVFFTIIMIGAIAAVTMSNITMQVEFEYCFAAILLNYIHLAVCFDSLLGILLCVQLPVATSRLTVNTFVLPLLHCTSRALTQSYKIQLRSI